MQLLSEEREMPHDILAEQSVLGALLIDPTKIGTVQAILQVDDFYKRAHQLIFEAMERVFDRDGSFDYGTLMISLNATDALENAGGEEYLAEIISRAPSVYYTETYAVTVKNQSILRKLIAASTTIMSDAFQAEENIQDVLDRSEKLILSIGENNQSNKPQEMNRLIKEAFDRIIKLSEEKREIVGLPSGYIDLDRLTSGFQPDQLIILAARPSVGKTAFALNIAQNVGTKSKVPVVIFSLEMGAIDMVYRMICAEGNIHAGNLKTGQLTDDEWNSLTVATDTLKNAPIFIDDTAGIRVNEIRAKCRRLKQENPDLGLIVIDYLQLIEGNGRENRQQEVSEISRQLKKLAKELSVPIIALSQLSRGLEHRQNKRPMLSDIRESGSIEQDADIVAFLYREDYHQQEGDEETEKTDDLPDNSVEVILAKNRSGARDTVRLLFTKEYNKFSSLTYMPEPPINSFG
ncbi:replicative DNA helicase [Facklamia sp. 252]|uniref:replicative DNA helicase n=1 Tax=Facklamia sp. 252 TaxID=2678501 RepID=UPI0031FE4EE4